MADRAASMRHTSSTLDLEKLELRISSMKLELPKISKQSSSSTIKFLQAWSWILRRSANFRLLDRIKKAPDRLTLASRQTQVRRLIHNRLRKLNNERLANSFS